MDTNRGTCSSPSSLQPGTLDTPTPSSHSCVIWFEPVHAQSWWYASTSHWLVPKLPFPVSAHTHHHHSQRVSHSGCAMRKSGSPRQAPTQYVTAVVYALPPCLHPVRCSLEEVTPIDNICSTVDVLITSTVRAAAQSRLRVLHFTHRVGAVHPKRSGDNAGSWNRAESKLDL
ncbi:hypothetical protein AAHC03_04663 [Spirometra sp. Aus1]